jgi:L-ascorbate metabolism protein UlaG (beta-lactamase superfamily)
MQVTYIANEGFLILMGDNKILVDALFGSWESDWCDVPPGEVIEKMEKATGPFEGIDLILVTHAHVDHFNPEIVAAHLENNLSGILVCPRAVVEELKKQESYAKFRARVKEVTPAEGTVVEMEVNRVKIKVWRLPHGPYYVEDEQTGERRNKHEHVQHLVFKVEAGRQRFLHSGDWASAEGEEVPDLLAGEDRVYVAFLSPAAVLSLYGAGKEAETAHLKPGKIVLMHLLPGGEVGETTEAEKNMVAGLTIFKSPMESRWMGNPLVE